MALLTAETQQEIDALEQILSKQNHAKKLQDEVDQCSARMNALKEKAKKRANSIQERPTCNYATTEERIKSQIYNQGEAKERVICSILVIAIILLGAVGVVAAGWLTGNESISFAAALALSLGIALQNLPEGAIISMPLKSNGMKQSKAFSYGVLSGIIEPIGAVMTLLLANWIVPLLPYLLSFSAGAMLYVVVEELIPEMSEGDHSHVGPIFFAVGFTMMMVLDVALG